MKAMFQFNQTTISSFLNQPAILPLFSSSNDRNQAQSYLSFIGTVEQVWEDGFYLNTGNRTLEVDSWDLYRDSTQRYVSVGQQLTVTGEFDNSEFDAFSITLASSGGGNGSIGNNGDLDTIVGDNRNNVLRGTNGSDDIRGSGGHDRLLGQGGEDDLFGEAGNDILRSGAGSDDLFGGNGNDILVGGIGDDDLFGGAGNDTLRGGKGQDDLVGGAGQDVLIGGADQDRFVLQPGGNDIIRDFQDRIDELGLSGGLTFSDLVLQQQGNDTLILADGNRIALLLGVNANSITPADLD